MLQPHHPISLSIGRPFSRPMKINASFAKYHAGTPHLPVTVSPLTDKPDPFALTIEERQAAKTGHTGIGYARQGQNFLSPVL